MAVLALAAAGAAIGSSVGYASAGWMVGSFLGQMLFPAGSAGGGMDRTVEGPRLGDLSVQVSTYGKMIPVTFGTVRIAGNIIWSEGIRETRHETTTVVRSGKGGRKKSTSTTTTVTYTYSVSFAVAFCRGPIDAVTRIWADGKLLYDARPSNKGGMSSRGASIAVRLGTESQDVDAGIQANKGIAVTPAFRGLAHVVFRDLQLADFGQRVPQISAEITRGAIGAKPALLVAATGYTFDSYVVSSGGQFLYYLYGNVLYKVDAIGNRLVASATLPFSFCTRLATGAGKLYAIESNGNYSHVHEIDPDTLSSKARSGRVAALWDLVISGGGTIYAFSWMWDKIYVWPDGELPTADNPTPTVLNLTELGADWPTMGCIGADGACWLACGREAYGGPITLCRVEPGGAVDVFDLKPYLDQAEVICFDPGTGCLFIGGGGKLLKWNPSGGLVGEPLVNVVGPYSRGSFQRGVVGRSLWVTFADVARQIDTVTLATLRTVTLSDWGITTAGTAVCFEPMCNALWTLGRLGNNGAVKLLLDRVGASGVTVDLVVSEIAGMAGRGAGDLDVSDLATDVVQGYVIGRRSTARSCIEELMQAFLFDAVESGGAVKFVKRGQTPCATLTTDDLAATGPGSDPPPPMSITRVQDVELPALVNVLYMNPDADYQQGHQQARRLAVTTTDQSVTVELPMVLTDTQAARLAEQVLYTAWTERSRLEFQVTRRFARLEPTDVIDVVDANSTQRVRVIDATLGADGVIKLKAVAEDEEVYVSTRTGAATEFEASTIVFQGPTTLHLLDCPMLGDEDDDPGFYCAVNGQTDDWRGATVYSSSDGVTWNEAISFFGEATAGVAVTVLPDCPRWATWDRTSTVDVRMLRGDLASAADELAVLNGANAILLGDEILQFTTAQEIDENVYRLSNLLRGRRGTEWACATHAVGERLVKLDAVAIQRLSMSSAAIGQPLSFKAVTFGQFLDEVAVRSFTNTARALKPYAPVHIHGSRDGSGTLTITWIRRARFAAEWRDGVDVALGEVSEAYEVDVLNGTTVVRTMAVAAPAATYTAAQQTADFGTVQACVVVRIHQLNAIVGRGFTVGSVTL